MTLMSGATGTPKGTAGRRLPDDVRRMSIDAAGIWLQDEWARADRRRHRRAGARFPADAIVAEAVLGAKESARRRGVPVKAGRSRKPAIEQATIAVRRLVDSGMPVQQSARVVAGLMRNYWRQLERVWIFRDRKPATPEKVAAARRVSTTPSPDVITRMVAGLPKASPQTAPPRRTPAECLAMWNRLPDLEALTKRLDAAYRDATKAAKPAVRPSRSFLGI